MTNQLESLRKLSTIVADTGDIEAIKKYQPIDATTNPSLLLKAAQMAQYQPLIKDAVNWAKAQSTDDTQQIIDAGYKLAVNIGSEILNIILGCISTEVDARLSFNTRTSVEEGLKLIDLYQQKGISKNRILIKLASTWEGIQAAAQLEKSGINCNMTLLFNLTQARACAEAGVFLVSPFVGRILDWHTADSGKTDYLPHEDPGVQSVTTIYQYYKQHAYKTVVMGASFRNTAEIIELAGCDRLTISPPLLAELSRNHGDLPPKLQNNATNITPSAPLNEAEFRWQMNEDRMASEKLAEGIRNFAADQIRLETVLANYF